MKKAWLLMITLWTLENHFIGCNMQFMIIFYGSWETSNRKIFHLKDFMFILNVQYRIFCWIFYFYFMFDDSVKKKKIKLQLVRGYFLESIRGWNWFLLGSTVKKPSFFVLLGFFFVVYKLQAINQSKQYKVKYFSSHCLFMFIQSLSDQIFK